MKPILDNIPPLSQFPLVLLILFSFTACNNGRYDSSVSISNDSTEAEYLQPQIELDLDQIKERGKLVAITGYSSTSYFIYRGRPMGYEYELLSRFADYLDVELEIVLEEDINEIMDMLNRGEGDIIAYSLTVSNERAKRVAFTDYHNLVRQVLIQRKPKMWRRIAYHRMEDSLIRNPIELDNQVVHVRKNSSYVTRLKNLEEEIGGDIKIIEAPGNVETEQLIKQVANGEIEYTVADENLALINKTYYSNLDVNTPVSFPQKIAWAVRKNSPELLAAANEWIQKMRRKSDYYVIYNKYYKNQKAYRERVGSEYYSMNEGRISAYDNLIKQHGEKIEWDWRLLAAQVYQESRFDPMAQSWAGAKGLMQLIPATAKRFGARNLFDPRESIEAGTAYLKWLEGFWSEKVPDRYERLKFVLASYNVGPGHVMDARRLAEKYGKDPDIWEDNVAEYLRQKSKRKYYMDEVVRYGYCRGDEPYKYVKEILYRYDHYQKVIENESENQFSALLESTS